MKNGILRFGLGIIVTIFLYGCGSNLVNSSASTDSLNENADITTAPVSSSQSCVSQVSQTLCPMIAFPYAVNCSANSLLDGQPIPAISATGANDCQATESLQMAACQAGLTYEQVEDLNVVCTNGPMGLIPIPSVPLPH
jgi:hypothetical protein